MRHTFICIELLFSVDIKNISNNLKKLESVFALSKPSYWGARSCKKFLLELFFKNKWNRSGYGNLNI